MGTRTPWVAGVDSSTQSTKLLVVDARSGQLQRTAAVPHPPGTEVPPERWWDAFEQTGAARAEGVAALGITGQQHTAILLDAQGRSVRDALLWNDLRSAAAGARLVDELGPRRWLEGVGLLPDSAHPVSKLRWLARHEPEHAERVHTVLLPHDWLTWRMRGGDSTPTTDRSDASSTGYWSVSAQREDQDLLHHSFGRAVRTPEVLAPDAVAGRTEDGALLAAGCGDNAATHLALATGMGDMVISIGTSATVTMRTSGPVQDPTGLIDTMADAREGCIPIIAMLNGARVLTATARMLGLDLLAFERLARIAPAHASGAILLPYLDGERNPPRPPRSGRLVGLSREALEPTTIARAAVLGLACAVAEAAEALIARLGEPGRILLVGGGARSGALRQAIADLLGRSLEIPEAREHAALGAARQAVWALSGELPAWPVPIQEQAASLGSGGWRDDVRAGYREAAAGTGSALPGPGAERA